MVLSVNTTTNDVYNIVSSLIRNLNFPSVIYDVANHTRTHGDDVPIASLELNETRVMLGSARNHRNMALDKTSWVWKVIITFHKEVDFTNLIALFQGVPRFDGTRILATAFEITHPPRQNPNTGSRVEFTVDVLLLPL